MIVLSDEPVGRSVMVTGTPHEVCRWLLDTIPEDAEFLLTAFTPAHKEVGWVVVGVRFKP